MGDAVRRIGSSPARWDFCWFKLSRNSGFNLKNQVRQHLRLFIKIYSGQQWGQADTSDRREDESVGITGYFSLSKCHWGQTTFSGNTRKYCLETKRKTWSVPIEAHPFENWRLASFDRPVDLDSREGTHHDFAKLFRHIRILRR
jgi:hypothetical protein